MFDQVAPRYDLLNHLLSVSLDRVWRRRSARTVARTTSGPVLDLCCGTGDQAIALTKASDCVVAADFSIPMLALAQGKYTGRNGTAPVGLAADALDLPFADQSFGGVTVSFGLRNVARLDGALEEIRRVLRPDGRLVVLEFALPRARLLRAGYLFYFRRILPWIGGLLSPADGAYQYLPDSVLEFPQREEMSSQLRSAGFAAADWRDLAGGTVCLYEARASLS
jgi:demethylmenaquinone methyltransferase/2-methoxy-6-polyprenyl-1,4-benzoquinol methylase